jgi:hypothetical protein
LEEFTRTLEEAEVDVVAPGVFDCDTNPLNAESLWATFAREGKPLPADIDPKSFRQWLVIQFKPGPDEETDFDAYYDCWVLVVGEKGQDRIAYFEIHDPD